MSNYLAMSIILIGVSSLLAITLSYYLFKFYKLKANEKKVSYINIIIISTMILLAEIFGIVACVSSTNNDENVALITWVIGLVFLILSIIPLFTIIQNFAIALTPESINLIGEKIDYANITKIMQDAKNKKIYVFYKQGKRVTKKMKMNSSLVEPKFFDEKITGFKVEQGDVNAYYNDLIKNG